MKVTAEQVAQGLAAYIDRELLPQIPGLRKWGLGFLAARSVQLVQHYMTQYKDVLSLIGVMGDDGMIDIDTVAAEMKRIAATQGPVTEHLPIFGDVTFTVSDIDKLHTYIVN